MEHEAREDPPQKHTREQRHKWKEKVLQGLEMNRLMKELIRVLVQMSQKSPVELENSAEIQQEALISDLFWI